MLCRVPLVRTAIPPKPWFLQEPHGVTSQEESILHSHHHENLKSYKAYFYSDKLLAQPQHGRTPTIRCPWLITQYIGSYSPYLEDVTSIHKVRLHHAVGSRDPLNMDTILTTDGVSQCVRWEVKLQVILVLINDKLVNQFWMTWEMN
jgi:hypothetical protein